MLFGCLLFGTVLTARAHSSTFIFALLEVDANGDVRISVTMDVGENALVDNDEEAREVLTKALRVEIDNTVSSLSDWGKMRFEHRDQHDADAPGIGRDNEKHPLLTGIWQGHFANKPFILHTAEQTPFDIILWTRDPTIIAGGKKSLMLIVGDVSPLITYPPPAPFPWAIVLMVVGAVIGVVLGRRTQRPAAVTES